MANQSKLVPPSAAGSKKHPAPSASANPAGKKKKTSQHITSSRAQTKESTNPEQSDSDNAMKVADGEINEPVDTVEESVEDELSKLSTIIEPISTHTANRTPEQLTKKWTSPIYAFYHPVPSIGYHEGRRYHSFHCAFQSCKYTCRRYLDKKDANSTGNLQKHVKTCWGDEALKAAESARDVDVARESVVKGLNENGSIKLAFEQHGKGKVTYSNITHTRTETR
jgi:hypothetical protein